MPRFYDADSTDRYLRTIRGRFQGSIASIMAATQSADDPRIESLQSIDRVLLSVQRELERYAVTIDPIVPADAASKEDVVDAEEVLDDDVPFQETQGGT